MNLKTYLNQLEDENSDTSARIMVYRTIKEAFDAKGILKVTGLDRLLVVIEKDFNKRSQTSIIYSALSVLASIVEKNKVRVNFMSVYYGLMKSRPHVFFVKYESNKQTSHLSAPIQWQLFWCCQCF